jgi:hypothetical protein
LKKQKPVLNNLQQCCSSDVSVNYADAAAFLCHTGKKVGVKFDIPGPFAKFVDSPYYSKSELCGGEVTVSFWKYLPWQAMHLENVLQTVDHFEISCLGVPFSQLEKSRNLMG